MDRVEDHLLGEHTAEHKTEPTTDTGERLFETGPRDNAATDPHSQEGGWGWVCVAARAVMMGIVFGIMYGFGVIYVELVDVFESTRTEAAWVGSVATGALHFAGACSYLPLFSTCGPLSSLLIGRYGCRVTSVIAGCVASMGFLASFFSPNLHFLYLSFGLLGGTGLGLAMVPAVVAVSSYFRKRRGLALSMSSVGAGVGTMCFPPLFRILIEVYGWRGLMLVLSGVALNLVVCGALFMMPTNMKSSKKLESNEHVPKEDTEHDPKDGTEHGLKDGTRSRLARQFKDFFTVLHNRAFTVILIIITTTYLVYIVPFVHLPDLARLTGVTKGNASFLVSIMGIAGIAGRLVFGFVSTLECVSVLLCHACMLLVCGVATLLCTLINTYTLFAVYAAVHGGFIGSYTGFIAVVITEVVGLDQTANALGMLTFLGGIFILLASPLAGFLYDRTGSYLTSFYFTGVVFVVCGLVYVGLILYLRHQRLQASVN